LKRAWKAWVGFGISAVALVLTLRHVSFSDLGRALAGAAYGWFVPAAIFWAASFLARAWRWSLLMGGAARVVTTLHAQNIGYMLNCTLPFRLGEVARAYVIGERTPVSMPRALSSIIVERVLDLATVVGMFAVAALYVPMPAGFAHAAAVGGALVLVLIAGAFVLVWQADAAEKRIVAPLARAISPKLAERVVPKFHELCGGFRAVGSAQRVGMVAALTIIVWGGNILCASLVMCSFFGSPLHVDQASLVVITSNLGGALPSAPGGLGIVQGFAKAALVVPFHVDEDTALAFVLVWSLGQQLLLIVLGMLSLARVGMSFSEVRAPANRGAP
jgi:glycosyltransferase 2 family protein